LELIYQIVELLRRIRRMEKLLQEEMAVCV